MKAVFHGACRNCAFFFAVCHGDEFIEEFFHFLGVFASGRWGLPVGPGGERAFGFKVLDVFQSYVSNFQGCPQHRVGGLALRHELDDEGKFLYCQSCFVGFEGEPYPSEFT